MTGILIGSKPLDEIVSLGDEQAALFLSDRLRQLDSYEKLSYAERGMILHHVQFRRLHERITNPATGNPFSFSGWVRSMAPWSYSSCFAALRDVEELKDIPAEHLAEIPQSNFPILRQLSTAVRAEPQVIEAAKTQTPAAFTEQIRKDHPEQHLEARKMLRVNMDESALAKVEEAITEAMERGATSRGEALESICAEALLAWTLEQEVEEALK